MRAEVDGWSLNRRKQQVKDMFGIFNATTIPALEQTLTFAQRRHELLVGNLANLDTPDYRSRDLDVGDFQNALAESIVSARRTATNSVSPIIFEQTGL